MHELTPAARLAAWGTAAVTGAVSPDDAADAVTGPEDAGHRVFGLDGDTGGVNVAYALGALRRSGTRGLRLVLPRPGDLTGLAGPPSFNEKALARGEAVLTVGGPPRALLAEGRGAWTVHAVAGDARTALDVRSAEKLLVTAMCEAAELLAAMDVARFEPVAAEVLAHQSASRRRPALPLSYPPQAHHVLEQAMRVLTIVELARRTDGAGVTAAEVSRRAEVLRGLDTAARRGLEAACSAPPA